MFAQQRLADGDCVPFADIGTDRQTVDGRRADDGQFAHARQRQLQRPRDRSRRQGQHVNIRPHLFQTFFVLNAEMLFFVDDEQAKVFEIHRFGQQRMGADDDIDLPVRDAFARFVCLFRRHEPRQWRDIDRETTEPFGEPFVVLTRQQRRWRHNGHLYPRHSRHECRADRDLGLAKANIAANQAVHWAT